MHTVGALSVEIAKQIEMNFSKQDEHRAKIPFVRYFRNAKNVQKNSHRVEFGRKIIQVVNPTTSLSQSHQNFNAKRNLKVGNVNLRVF